MDRGIKTALKHAANAIDGIRGQRPTLGASASTDLCSTKTDGKGRIFASCYLVQRRNKAVCCQSCAQRNLVDQFGFTAEQARKLDRVAASTHNLRQRNERVASFLRRLAEDSSYVGFSRPATTGAVAASI